MSPVGTQVLDDRRAGLRSRIIITYVLLLALNIAAWAWAAGSFARHPLLLGTAFLAYGLGLRHAVDADHIAAIDNVTRKLMQEGRRPVTAGLFFSLGHSTIVILATLAIALAASAFRGQLHSLQVIGGVVGTLISGGFLFLIAIMNLAVFLAVLKTFRHVKAGGAFVEEDLDILLARGGLLARIFRPLFRMITRGWHMYPLGLLFGLGFDTASEIGLLGLSAAGISHGMPIWTILVFPALFTAGMSLIDTTDGILMLGAYGWAFMKPMRRLYYNMTITLVSVLVALLVGGVETLGLVAGQLGLSGRFWGGVSGLNNHLGMLGVAVIGIFAAIWGISAAIYRFRGYDDLSASIVGRSESDLRP